MLLCIYVDAKETIIEETSKMLVGCGKDAGDIDIAGLWKPLREYMAGLKFTHPFVPSALS